MLGKMYDGQYCSVARSLEIIGERWSLLILREALLSGTSRFSDFQHNLGVATNVLTSRLEYLVESGLMERDADGNYRLLEPGRDFLHVLMAFGEWGDKWRAPDGPPGIYRHTDCGETVSLAAKCEKHGELANDEIHIEPGPGTPPEYIGSRRP